MLVGTVITGLTISLSILGCGFLGIYHIGVASCIREYAPHLFAEKIAGASAGAIAAVGLITNCDLGKIAEASAGAIAEGFYGRSPIPDPN